MKPEVEIYDTTLRDGSQGEGINFSVKDKLRIAEKLDAFGVHYIEGGWPGSNPKDIEFFAEARRRKFKRARLAAFGSTRRKGVAVESDDQVRLLLEAQHARGHHLRQDLAAAREGSPAHDARREPGDDRRHGALPEGPRPVRHLRRGARLRRVQGRPRIRPGDLAGGGEGRRGLRGPVRHQRRLPAARSGGHHRRGPREADDAPRHPHARRHRPGSGQRAGSPGGRGDARAGHHQRLRRTHRQLQPHQRRSPTSPSR